MKIFRCERYSCQGSNQGNRCQKKSCLQYQLLRNGYFTVEAAFIVPIALGTIVFIIYMMFYQYDRCLLEQDIGALAMKGTVNFREDGQSAVNRLNEQAAFVYGDKYVAFEDGNVDIEVKGGKVTVEGKGKIYLPFAGNKWIQASFANKKQDPVTFIRACRKLHGNGE